MQLLNMYSTQRVNLVGKYKMIRLPFNSLSDTLLPFWSIPEKSGATSPVCNFVLIAYDFEAKISEKNANIGLKKVQKIIISKKTKHCKN